MVFLVFFTSLILIWFQWSGRKAINLMYVNICKGTASVGVVYIEQHKNDRCMMLVLMYYIWLQVQKSNYLFRNFEKILWKISILILFTVTYRKANMDVEHRSQWHDFLFYYLPEKTAKTPLVVWSWNNMWLESEEIFSIF